MGYRNGTYIAFDGLDQKNPSQSDFRYYGTIQAWAENKDIEFNYVDSHEKTYAVHDSSEKETLKSRVRERLSNSKNVIVIISSNTRMSGSMLSYEIEQAVDRYNLPLIIAYTDYSMLANPSDLAQCWPTALMLRVKNGKAKAIHVPFLKNAILDAINQFDVHKGNLKSSLSHYSQSAHHSFGCISSQRIFINTRK